MSVIIDHHAYFIKDFSKQGLLENKYLVSIGAALRGPLMDILQRRLDPTPIVAYIGTGSVLRSGTKQ